MGASNTQFQFNLTSNDIKVENISKSNCMPKSVCKYHTRYEIQVNMIFTDSSSSSSSSSFETTNLTNHRFNELEILHVSRFLSDLVHRHIICNPFTS